MPVEIFSKDQFEKQALPYHKQSGEPLWKYAGLRDGEHTYIVPVGEHGVGIEVRSSVKTNGMSAATGEDSIRCWIVDIESGKPWGSKVSRWTTRLPGWGDRTKEVIKLLWKMAEKIQPCPKCNQELVKVFKVKKDGPNKGRIFLKCNSTIDGETCTFFEWLDGTDEGEVTAAPKKQEQQQKPVGTDPRHGVTLDRKCPDCEGKLKQWVQRLGSNAGKLFCTCQGIEGDGCGYREWIEEEQKQTCFAIQMGSKRIIAETLDEHVLDALRELFTVQESVTISLVELTEKEREAEIGIHDR